MTKANGRDSRETTLEGNSADSAAYSRDTYHRAWEKANECVDSISVGERDKLRANREVGDRWAEDVVAGRRDPLDGIPHC